MCSKEKLIRRLNDTSGGRCGFARRRAAGGDGGRLTSGAPEKLGHHLDNRGYARTIRRRSVSHSERTGPRLAAGKNPNRRASPGDSRGAVFAPKSLRSSPST